MVMLFAGKLLHIDRLSGLSLEQAAIRHSLPDAEIASAVEFICAKSDRRYAKHLEDTD